MTNTTSIKRIETIEGKRDYWIPEDNRAYPSVTSCTSIIEKPALVPWAVKLAIEAIEKHEVDLANGSMNLEQVRDLLARAKRAHKDKKETAAAFGTLAHAEVSDFLADWIKNGKPEKKFISGKMKFPIPEVTSCCKAFADWAREIDFYPRLTEKTVVSRKHGYAGTLDLVGWVNGTLSLVDIKSSNGIWPEFFLQVVGYREALKEMNLENTDVKQMFIVRLGKEDGAFEVKDVHNPDGELLNAFLAAKTLYLTINKLKHIGKPEKITIKI